jgi:hypothetical protein
MTTQNQNPKKSETLEFRLPHDEKASFLAQVSQNGQSASDALRQLVGDYVKPAKASTPKRLWAIGAVLALALGLVAVPVLADRTLFASYDLDGNGRITPGEITDAGDREIIEALDTDKNGWVSFLEFKATGVGETYHITGSDNHTGSSTLSGEFIFTTFELGRERKVRQNIVSMRVPVPVGATEAQIAQIQGEVRAQIAAFRKQGPRPAPSVDPKAKP